jgi:hypothetical protein
MIVKSTHTNQCNSIRNRDFASCFDEFRRDFRRDFRSVGGNSRTHRFVQKNSSKYLAGNTPDYEGMELAADCSMKTLSENKPPIEERNEQTTAGQQESRDRGNSSPENADLTAPAGTAGPQAYDRSGREFKRSGQIHSDTNDRT